MYNTHPDWIAKCCGYVMRVVIGCLGVYIRFCYHSGQNVLLVHNIIRIIADFSFKNNISTI